MAMAGRHAESSWSASPCISWPCHPLHTFPSAPPKQEPINCSIPPHCDSMVFVALKKKKKKKKKSTLR
eukprot:NODE_4259_length_355_cov_50.143791_g3816_i0.p3 GENE.NODE_4259_length_355_cov_50.143791_g3816_i0~~NODE_4259_length_355_cov_50.143791_g3816_i0.p3  ORF type:complete len:68 (+),score=15.26 NODE_4259_length_355_cov_50.143791_g3816_i0:151-354(+)